MTVFIKSIFAVSSIFAISAFSADLVRVPGQIKGFEGIKKDKVIDGAVLLPSLSPADILSLNLDQLIGPSEKLKAGPLSADVPSNLFVPKQKENYGIFPVTFQKTELGYYAPRGQKDELTALWFKAPLKAIIDGRDNPMSVIPAVSVQKLGYLPAKDWSKSRYINMSLNKPLYARNPVYWSRKVVSPKGWMDIVLMFQQTPSNKWSLIDFIGSPQKSVKLKTSAQFNKNVKVLMLRMQDSEQMNYAQGYIRHAQRLQSVKASGVPAPLKAGMDGSQRVRWRNPGQGWMFLAVDRAERKTVLSFFKSLPFVKSFFAKSAEEKYWLNPSDQSFRLKSALRAGDSAALVFVGTSQEVAKPELGEESPEIFDFASEIRIRRLN